jgi:predicted AAA+ superfamily ATPase
MYPFEIQRSQKESVENNELYSTTKRAHVSHLLSEYLINGGIFDSYKFGPEFLRTLWRSVVDRDIIIRYRVRYPSTLEQLALLLLNSFGTKISTAKLTRQYNIKSQHTVKDYIHYLENVFLLFSVNKFSYKLKEQQTSFKKMYISDNGFIQALGFSFSENNGRLLENAVASELKRRCQLTNSVLYYWDDYHFECDFVVKKGKKINALYQVCSELKPENRDREVKGLIAAMKVFKINSGRIITMSQEDSIKEDRYKIDVIPAWRWFLETHE